MKKKQPPLIKWSLWLPYTFLSVGSPFIEEGGNMPQSHSIAVLSFIFLCFFLFIFYFFFQLYIYLLGYDCNNLKQRQAEYFFFIEILTSVLTIQSSISQFEFPFEQLFTIKLFQCFHIQMVVVPFLRNNPSAVMFFQQFIFPAKIFGAHLGFSLQVIHS